MHFVGKEPKSNHSHKEKSSFILLSFWCWFYSSYYCADPRSMRAGDVRNNGTLGGMFCALYFFLRFLGFGGITYGVMSTSWDETDEGSAMGLDEAKSNWVKMWGSDDPAAPNFKGRDADP